MYRLWKHSWLRRIWLFLYFYFYALNEPVHGVNIRSMGLAWELADIATRTYVQRIGDNWRIRVRTSKDDLV
jgi:hypothetical protein